MRASAYFGFLSVLIALWPQTAWAGTPACTAADIIDNESAGDCAPGNAPCTIRNDYDIGDGCLLDFGTRSVFIASGSLIDVGSGSVMLSTGDLTLDKNSELRGRGTGTKPNDNGGLILISASGDFTMLTGSSKSKIDVSADNRAGTIDIVASGSMQIAGRLLANDLSSDAGFGAISLVAGGSITVQTSATISARGGANGFGGSVDIGATDRIDVLSTIEVNGSEAGDMSLSADVVNVDGELLLNATGNAGSGGLLLAEARSEMTVTAAIRANGASSSFDFGGDGGSIELEVLAGDLHVAANILADGAGPDGYGDTVDLIAAGAVTIDATISSEGASQGDGGAVTVDARTDVFILGVIDASGGAGGGDVSVFAGRNINVASPLRAQGTAGGGFGGLIELEAGLSTLGVLAIDASLDAGGGGCSAENGCGFGGEISARACEINASAAARLLVNAPDGGSTSIASRGALIIASGALVNANATTSDGVDGTNDIEHSIAVSPVLAGSITPAPELTPLLVNPCATCGNAVLEDVEECDDGNDLSCDGCSWSCETENCDDGNACTADACHPDFGCTHIFLPANSSCDDGLACTTNDRCSGGSCSGNPLDCSTMAGPCAVGVCDEGVGGCTTTPRPDGTGCNDADPCTELDTCLAGICTGQAIVCDDGNACTSGQCNGGTCEFTTSANGTPCDDNDACTTADTCTSGLCSGQQLNCNDDNDCTNDQCVAGACQFNAAVDGSNCSDNDDCTTGDACMAGVCTGTGTLDCDDADACTADGCAASGGCFHDVILGCGAADLDLDGTPDDLDPCVTTATSDPPITPPDQNPTKFSFKATKLNDSGPTQSIIVSGIFNPANPAADLNPALHGAHLHVQVDATGPGLSYDIDAPGTATTGCDVKDAWVTKTKPTKTVWRYSNVSGALPSAGCAPGSAKGLRKLVITDERAANRAAVKFKAMVKKAVLGATLTAAPTRVTVSFALSARDGLATGAQAQAGQCAEFVIEGAPIMTRGRPSCRTSFTGNLVKQITCKGGP